MIYINSYYKGKMVTLDVSLTVYLSWTLGCVGILLLPYDMSLTLVLGVQSQSLVDIWNYTYLITFLLAWIILPMQYEYHNSGHFGFGKKVFFLLIFF